MAFEKKEGELGALWSKQTSKGEMLSGTIDGVGDVVMFKVDQKSSKSPAWRVFKARPRESAPTNDGF